MSEVNKQEKIRKVFLDNLPRWEKGKSKKINWINSIGYKVRFIYEDIEGWIEIADYINKGQYLYIKYLDKDIFEITTGRFQNCMLGKLLGKVTKEFKVGTGQTFINEKRNLTIIDREYRIKFDKDNYKCNRKYYKYRCNKCGNEDWMLENELLTNEQGCNTCCPNPQKIVLGINTIWDTDRWMVDLGVSEEDARRYTCCSNKKIKVVCPNCSKEKDITLNQIYKSKSISCNCGDKTPYPEKFVFNLLEQLELNFKTQLSKSTFKWCEDKRYDFYFKYNHEEYIIETHGLQHYEAGFERIKSNKKAKSLEEEQENDKFKKQLALVNGIKEENYIVIDCRKSDLEFIKQNILNSRLNEIFDLSNIDWVKCEEFALSNRVKEACDLWNSGIESIKKIGEIMKLDKQTIRKYVKSGSKSGKCSYDSQKEIELGRKKTSLGKQVEIFKDGDSLGIFPSCAELSRQSEQLFGVKLSQSKIGKVANGKGKSHRDFEFKYTQINSQQSS